MTVRKQQKVQGWGQSHVLHVAMSRDGKWIVPDARGASSPSGADLMKVNEEELTFTQIRDYHQSFGQMVAGSLNRYWTFGNSLYTLDITKMVRTFSGSPVAIHPRLDVAVSKTTSGLTLERFSDATPIASVPLKYPSKNTNVSSNDRFRDRSIIAADPTIQFDLKNNLVFLGDRFRGYWVDLSEFADKLTPLMMVQAPSEVTSLVGRQMRIPIAVTNGGDKAKLTISQGPKTAKLDSGAFVWQPQAEDVGFTTVQFEIKSTEDDRMLDTVDMTVQVTLPKLDLGFHAQSMELSPSGRYLLVWGVTPGQEDRHPAHTGADDVAVFDIQQLKLLTRKTLPQGIRCATIDDKYVCLSPNSGNLFYRLNRSLSQSNLMFLQSAPTQLIKIGGDRLLAVGEQMQLFDVETMKPVPDSFDAARVNPRQGILALGHNEIQLGNQVVNRTTGKTVRVTEFVNLPSLVQGRAQLGYNPMDNNQTPIRWGRRLQGNMLANHKGNRISNWPGQRSGILSQRWPMAILIASSQERATTTTTMELVNLIDGTVEHTSVIDVSANNKGSRIPSFYGARNEILEAGDQVVFLKGIEVLLATIPEKVAQAMPMPTYFLQQQKGEIEVGDAVKLKLTVGGKSKGVIFNLLAEYLGVVLDSATGELTIDTPKLWETFVQQAAGNGGPGSFGRRNQPSPMSHAENAKLYKELTGKDLPADKLAAQLPISAVLLDPEGQEDGIQFSVIVVGSRKQLDDETAARQAEQAKQIAAMQEARKQQEEARAQEAALREAQLKKDADANKGVGERLDDLEVRMRRIEAALDSILKRLGDER